MNGAVDTAAQWLGGLTSLASAMPSLPLGGNPLMNLMAQAHMATSAALLRSAQRGSESWVQFMKESQAESSEGARLDAARAHLRRLGEISADEAKQVQSDLLALAERMRELTASTTPASSGVVQKRRAKAKP